MQSYLQPATYLKKANFRTLLSQSTICQHKWTRSYIDQIWTLESPFLSRQWTQTSDVFRLARQNKCEVLLSGQWGEQLVNSKPTLKDFFPKPLWKQLKQHLFSFLKLPGNLHQKNLYQLLQSKNHYLCSEWLYKIGRKFNVMTVQPFLDRDLVQFLFDVRSFATAIDETNLLRESIKPFTKSDQSRADFDVGQGFVSNNYVLEVWKRLFTEEFFDTLEAEDGESVELLLASPLRSVAIPKDQQRFLPNPERWVSG